MMPDRRRTLLFSGAGAAIVVGILAAANVVGRYLYVRADFSAGGIYSISQGTRGILGELKDNLVVKMYYTRGLPSPFGLNETYLRSLLDEYRSAGRGRVRVEYHDPEQEAARKEALSAGVSPVRINVMASDKFEVKEAYMGLALLYQGKAETIPVVQNTADLEYHITRRIRKLTATAPKTVGFVGGHGEKTSDEAALGEIFEILREQMTVETVSLDKPIPASVDALWLLGPQKALGPGELERLKAWTGAGRSLGILLDRRWVDMRSFFTSKMDTGLEKLLKAWGVEVREGLIVDAQAETIQLRQQSGMIVMTNIVQYPYIPVANNFNPDHPATRGLDVVSLPYVHPIRFEGEGKGLRYTWLARSSPQSWYVTQAVVSPYEQPAGLETAPKGPFDVAGIVEGDFYKVTPTTWPAVETAGTVAADKQRPGRVVVVGTSRLIQAELSVKAGNVAMLLNLIEWSLQDESLLSIRSKGMSYRHLKPLSSPARFAVKNILIFFPPFALVAGGAAAYRKERSRRKSLPAAYAS